VPDKLGVGLKIKYCFAESHGGSFDLTKVPGQGAITQAIFVSIH
jgi:hypothetical protein